MEPLIFQPLPQSPERAKPATPRKSVLLVDDDRLWLSALSRNMEREGFQVITATSASGALKAVKESPVDLIISDLRMPRMDGLELRDSLSSDILAGAIPFVFLTGYKDESDCQAAKSLGVDHLLEKSADMGALTTLARQLT